MKTVVIENLSTGKKVLIKGDDLEIFQNSETSSVRVAIPTGYEIKAVAPLISGNIVYFEE